ncbi:MAG: Spy/CpxP family protein refolding chaperone [Alphaproteobacteria bacterium]
MKRIYRATALAGAILAGAGGLAFAAGGPDGKHGQHRGGHHHMHKASFHKGGGFGPGFSMRHIDGRLAFLKAELKITEAQEPQWDAVETALRSSAERMSELRREMRGDRPARGERGPRGERMQRGERGDPGQRAERPERPRLNPVERLERMEKASAATAESAREVRTALAPLYESLSDEQKAMADRLLRRGGPPRR